MKKPFLTTVALLTACALLTSCGPTEPVRLGFLGGISGRFADLGATGRNGALLAVEQRNQRGGIRGRQVELVARDDEQNNEKGLQGLRELVEQNVIGVVGPMTSSIAVAINREAEMARVVLMSPTSVTNALTGKDGKAPITIARARDFAPRPSFTTSRIWTIRKTGRKNIARPSSSPAGVC